MDFDEYIRRSLDDINSHVKEVKEDQRRHTEKLDIFMESIRSKQDEQSIDLSNLQERTAIVETQVDVLAGSVKQIKHSAWALFVGVVASLASVLVKVIIGK